MCTITFYRKGFANNSSSSHSLVFCEENLEAYDNCEQDKTDFGWEQFIASTTGTKTSYFLAQIFYSFKGWVRDHDPKVKELSESEHDEYGVQEENLITKKFTTWLIDNKLINLSLEFKEDKKIFKEYLQNLSVDHQSVIRIPLNRKIEEGLNVPFIKAVTKELLKPQYAVAGGSDNSDDFLPFDGKEKNSNLTHIWKFLNNCYGTVLCVEDPVTKEFVISNTDDGDIIKILFD